MWTRSEIKGRAKDALRKNYWKALLVSFILAIFGANESGVSFSGGSFWKTDKGEWPSNGFGGIEGIDPHVAAPIIAAVSMIAILAVVLGLSFKIFLSNPIAVGGRRYFLSAADSEGDLNDIGFSFGSGRYRNVVKTMFWRALMNFLWYLALIIPGIVMSYAYRMVPYILAENPGIDYRRALEISVGMTRGHKLRMWVLDLSFIGWMILGVLLLFVGVLFVLPYVNSTYAQLYLVLREEAVRDGICGHDELSQGGVGLS